MSFKAVNSQIDFPQMERELLDFWYKNGIVEKYLQRNKDSDKKFSFLDGPITANNPMGVHHAWGRTYKDLWQRWYNMRGFKERFQNGFDEQGLWVEVEVEKELGLETKKDIENLVPGDKFASLEKFVNLCKERVKKFSGIQTEQSKRLGYFMDWDNSYHTSSDQNNYEIWHFLKTVWEKGWVYKGHDSVPWCPRCGTAISQHEILTEDYRELTHDSVYVGYPIKDSGNEYLLVWTTTPWTLPGNVVAAVDPEKDYVVATGEAIGDKRGFSKAKYYLSKAAAERLNLKIEKSVKGSKLVGLRYNSPFDHLPRVRQSMGGYEHQVLATDPVILPVTDEEGTGIVHIAPGAGTEDFALSKKLGLPVIELIDESANYLNGLGDLSLQNAKNNPGLIFNYLKGFADGKYLFDIVPYTHRYPACWRCKTELVWRVVDEWYIAVDRADDSGQTYREQMKEVIKNINWIPKWGYERELDWLNNLHDWLISKKRYWGLALPIWECAKCGNFEVIGSKEELKNRAVEGWDKFTGHSPHRPWVDQIKIRCPRCAELLTRIPDVGNPWLDAGIVPFSTLPEGWFPADFVTEAFPGQFKNWFYSLIAMSTALKRTNPFKNLLGHALVIDEKGEPMHKSSKNFVPFDDGVEKIGADIMRWIYLLQNPENNLPLTYELGAETRRRFYLILWNVYKFFVDRASVEGWVCELERGELRILDRWILARLTEVVLLVNESLGRYDAATASRAIEEFVVNDLSTWYVRRSRDRVGLNVDEKERNMVLGVLYGNLVTLSKLLAPFMPFIAEEMYKNLTSDLSVHLTDYPVGDRSLLNGQLVTDMKRVREVVERGHAVRKEANIKLRQPLTRAVYFTKDRLDQELEKIIADELNVKVVEHKINSDTELRVELDTNITPSLRAEGEARELIRQIQQMRKDQGLTLKDRIEISAPDWPVEFREMILKMTAADRIDRGGSLTIKKL